MRFWAVMLLFFILSCKGTAEFFQSSDFEPAATALKNAGEEAAQGDFLGAALAVATAAVLGGGGYLRWRKKKANAKTSNGS